MYQKHKKLDMTGLHIHFHAYSASSIVGSFPVAFQMIHKFQQTLCNGWIFQDWVECKQIKSKTVQGWTPTTPPKRHDMHQNLAQIHKEAEKHKQHIQK